MLVDAVIVTTPAAAAPDEMIRLVVIGQPGAEAAVEGAVELAVADGGASVVARQPALDAQVIDVPAAAAGAVAGRLERSAAVRAVEPIRTYEAGAVPGDPAWIDETGFQAMQMPAAWDITTGSPTVTIAVVDTGVDPVGDIAGRVLPGYNSLDGSTNVSDVAQHGTQVASIAASAGNDGAGTAGMCWQCRILPVRVLDDGGSGSSVSVAAGIVWAADHGADVINLSLGGPDFSQLVADAVAHARSKDVVVVAAAGNEGPGGGPDFPAAVPGTLSVGASNSLTSLFNGSNRGVGVVDVAAPGCTPAGPTVVTVFCGTSASAPIAAGLVALLRSARPDMSEGGIRRLVHETATVIPDITYGHVRPLAALRQSPTAADVAPIERPPGRVAVEPGAFISTIAPVVRGVVAFTVTGSDRYGPVTVAVALVTPSFGYMELARRSVDATEVTESLSIDSRFFPDGPARIEVTVSNESRSARITSSFEMDNTGPRVDLIAPPSGSTVRGPFVIGLGAEDPHGVDAVLIARNGELFAGFTGPGPQLITVPVSSTGPVDLIAAAIDGLGNIGLNRVILRADLNPPKAVVKAKRVRRRRR